MERQKSVPGVPPSLDGANHGTLRRQLSGGSWMPGHSERQGKRLVAMCFCVIYIDGRFDLFFSQGGS